MNILQELKSIIEPMKIPIETGVFSKEAPSEYIVLVPLEDSYSLNADNLPQTDVQGVRITIYTKGNYLKLKNKILSKLLKDFYITGRRYNGFDADTGYYQYTIDVAKNYEIDIEEDN